MTLVLGLLSVFSGGRERKKNGDCRRPGAGRRPFCLSFLSLTESGACWDYFSVIYGGSTTRRYPFSRVYVGELRAKTEIENNTFVSI